MEKLPNEMMIKIIDFCDTNTLLKLTNMDEFNIFKHNISRNIYKNGLDDWKSIHYNYIKNEVKYDIFKKMKDTHIFSFGYGEFRQISLIFPTEKYTTQFYNWWDNIFVTNLTKNDIKMELSINEIHKGIHELRTKHKDYFYRCPNIIHPLSLSFFYINSLKV